LVSLALQNAEAFEERSRQARIQQGFYRIAAVLGQPLSLHETFEAVAHAATVALGGASAALLMPHGDQWQLVAAHDLPGKLLDTLSQSEPGPALALAADERRIVAALDLVEDDRFEPEWRKAARAAGVVSLLAVPVQAPRSDRAGLALVLCAVAADGEEAALGGRASATAPLAGDVAQSRLPVAIESIERDRRGPSGDPLLSAGHSAYLGVPLIGPEGALHGVLAVYSRHPRPWRQEEVDALLALAGNTSAGLSNAELYQRGGLEKERSFAILADICDGSV